MISKVALLLVLIAFLPILLAENSTESGVAKSRNRRWSYFWPTEFLCSDKCKKAGKPFGRLLGTTCSCYCPVLNPPATNDPCDDSRGPSCQKYCRLLGYSGGACIVNSICWCFCRVRDPYILNVTDVTTVAPVVATTIADGSASASGGGGGGGGGGGATTAAPAAAAGSGAGAGSGGSGLPNILGLAGGGGGGGADPAAVAQVLPDIGENDATPPPPDTGFDGSSVAQTSQGSGQGGGAGAGVISNAPAASPGAPDTSNINPIPNPGSDSSASIPGIGDDGSGPLGSGSFEPPIISSGTPAPVTPTAPVTPAPTAPADGSSSASGSGTPVAPAATPAPSSAPVSIADPLPVPAISSPPAVPSVPAASTRNETQNATNNHSINWNKGNNPRLNLTQSANTSSYSNKVLNNSNSAIKNNEYSAPEISKPIIETTNEQIQGISINSTKINENSAPIIFNPIIESTNEKIQAISHSDPVETVELPKNMTKFPIPIPIIDPKHCLSSDSMNLVECKYPNVTHQIIDSSKNNTRPIAITANSDTSKWWWSIGNKVTRNLRRFFLRTIDNLMIS